MTKYHILVMGDVAKKIANNTNSFMEADVQLLGKLAILDYCGIGGGATLVAMIFFLGAWVR